MNQDDEIRRKEAEITKLYKLYELNRNTGSNGNSISNGPAMIAFSLLLGTVTGTTYVYMRKNDIALLDNLVLESRPTLESDSTYRDIAMSYPHTFMRNNVPVPDRDDGKGFRVLQFPLCRLYPPKFHPPEAIAGYLDELLIQFSWQELAEMVLITKREMVHSRAVKRADKVINKWLERQKRIYANYPSKFN